ncbi:hypothetical protein ACQJBY_042945 [Aegilops geniculata]
MPPSAAAASPPPCFAASPASPRILRRSTPPSSAAAGGELCASNRWRRTRPPFMVCIMGTNRSTSLLCDERSLYVHLFLSMIFYMSHKSAALLSLSLWLDA